MFQQGRILARRLYEAVAEARVHRPLHDKFTATFSSETISAWSKMIDEWNDDPMKAPNPYEEPEAGESHYC